MGPELNAGYSFVTTVVSIFICAVCEAGQMLASFVAMRKDMGSL